MKARSFEGATINVKVDNICIVFVYLRDTTRLKKVYIVNVCFL